MELTMTHFLKLLFQLILAPQNGWDDIRQESDDSHRVFTRGFLPLVAICAVSVFIQLLYHTDATLLVLVLKAIICFVAFFVTRYIAFFFYSLLLLRDIDTSLNPDRINLFILYTLSVMAMMVTVINCVPFSPVLILLALYSIVVIRMGSRFMGVLADRVGHFMFLSIGTLFLPPFLIMFLFGMLVE